MRLSIGLDLQGLPPAVYCLAADPPFSAKGSSHARRDDVRRRVGSRGGGIDHGQFRLALQAHAEVPVRALVVRFGVAGLVVMPWTIALLGCHHPLQALRSLPVSAIVLGNLFALGWGIANVLCGLCYYRIGVALTGAVLAGLGASAGAIVPMIFKGSGRFQDAPDLTSSAGMAVLAGVAVLLAGVVFAATGGFRPRPRPEEPRANLRRFPRRADHGRNRRSALLVHGLRLRLQSRPDRRPLQRR